MTRRRYQVFPALLALGSLLASCGGGGGGGGGVNPQVTPTPTATPAYSEAAFQCPSSDTSLNSQARGSVSLAIARRRPSHGRVAVSNSLLVVEYATGSSTSRALDARIGTLGARTVRDIAFSSAGRSMRIIHVTPPTLASVQSALRAVPGVRSVNPMRYLSPQTVSQPYFNGDPIFAGLPGSTAPLYQTASGGGQWDMNIVRLGYAFDYSQAGNGSGLSANASALGSKSIKLAIIDSGEDVTHPDLSGATIVRTVCFLTDPNGTQTTSSYVTDGFGHGTDVTGIAAASSKTPNFGFAGTSGNVSLMLYRVFPTPDDNCTPGNAAGANDPQCGAAEADIVSAIEDAAANGANVINMSLGQTSTPCVNGQDPDTAEGDAVASAIDKGIIVVASAGNDGTAGATVAVDAPGCDPGVIAVGASALNDGVPNGTGYAGANQEYVANYSNVGAGDVAHSASESWGIVAPGGDPSAADSSGQATDFLHWVENIWTTTPYQSSPSDNNFLGDCNSFDGFNEPTNCRTLIAGTSMSSPHVAGAAALILSVNPGYDSPAAMKQLLCSTADDIGDPNQGCGRLNIYNAMAQAIKDPAPPTPVP
jgi:subtilisin family serine protease